jgi:putative copper export protein
MGKTLAAVCAWLERTPFSQWLQTVEWVVPAVQTVHILAIAAVMGSMLFFNLRLLGLTGREVPLVRVSRRFIPVIWTAVLVLFLSGAVMIAAEPARSLLNPVFQLKMALLLTALGLTVATVRPLRRRPGYWSEGAARGRVARLCAISSFGLWVAILFAGRWIAYTRVH